MIQNGEFLRDIIQPITIPSPSLGGQCLPNATDADTSLALLSPSYLYREGMVDMG